MDNIYRLIFFAASLFIVVPSFAELRDFQTTRLISTGGTGVGSILMDEATLLNPAPLAFFTVTSFYAQKTKTSFDDKTNTPPTNIPKTDNWGFIASDGNGNLGASISYQKQKSGGSERKRWAAAMAIPADKTSAMGISIRRTSDRDSRDSITYEESSNCQFVLGVTHAVNSSFTLGLVVIDPTKRIQNDTKALVGIQYVYQEFIAIMIDGGTDYTQTMREKSQYHAALQFKVFSDVFLRAGVFEDKAKHERGNGAGLGWVTPKLVFEAAIGSKSLVAYENIRTKKQEAKEASFSLSYRF